MTTTATRQPKIIETMNEAERYAKDRIERYAEERIADLTKAIAGCLTPDTLDSLIHDISIDAHDPVPEDLAQFGLRMSKQRDTL